MASTRFVSVLLACAVLAICTGVATADSKPFSFYEYFQGDFVVKTSMALFQNGDQSSDEIVGHYSMQKENGTTSVLVGRYYTNNTETGDVSEEQAVRVVLEDPASGTFYMGRQDAEESEMKAVFSFSFTQHDNGVATSVGAWKGEVPSVSASSTSKKTAQSSSEDEGDNDDDDKEKTKKAKSQATKPPADGSKTPSSGARFYEFTVFSSGPFTLSIFDSAVLNGAQAQSTIFYGYKVPVVVAKTFFQQYGTWIMFGGVMVLNFWLKSKSREWQARAGDGAAAAAGTPAKTTAVAKSKKTK